MKHIEKYLIVGVDESLLQLDESNIEEIIKTQRVGPAIFNTYLSGFSILELVFEKESLERINLYSDGVKHEMHDIPEMSLLNRYRTSSKVPAHLVIAKSSLNWTGGIPPNGFNIPRFCEKFTLHFVGSLSQDSFPILPFERLNIFCPEFLSDFLFIDYSDYYNPTIINEDVIEMIQYPIKSTPFEIKIFDKICFDVVESGLFLADHLGFANIPLWLQNIQIPRCPVTNEVMDFLVNFSMDQPISRDVNSYHSLPYLYVFINPKTSIVALLYQM